MDKNIKSLFLQAVKRVSSDISRYTLNPGKDLIRNRKLGPDTLMTFLVSCGSSGTRMELFDFFGFDAERPSASAFNQQRAKLKPQALEAVFHAFNSSAISPQDYDGYRLLAADGTTFSFFSNLSFSPPEYFVPGKQASRGFFSMHLNAFYDLQKHTYSDALIQPIHHMDEYRAFCDMVDRHYALEGIKDIFIGDIGYCSYNNMAHVMKKEQYFLFRTKDIHSKGLVGNFDLPDTESFDVPVSVTLYRNKKNTVQVKEGFYKRHVNTNTSFDYIGPASADTYDISFRIVRFPVPDGSFECIVTNLPPEDFPPERIKLLYFARWGIEGAFRKLKHTIGLLNFHAYKPEYIKQEIWAKLIAYNIAETLVRNTVIKQGGKKHEYKVNFSIAAHICRVFLRPSTEKDPLDVMLLLQGEVIPVRNDRQYHRNKTGFFRKTRHLTYRAS